MQKEESEGKYFLLNQLGEETIFSIVGTFGKPYIKLGTGYASMNDGSYFEASGTSEDAERCRILDTSKLKKKYNFSQAQLEAWKEHIVKVARTKKQ